MTNCRLISRETCARAQEWLARPALNRIREEIGIRTSGRARCSLILRGTTVGDPGYRNALIRITDAHRNDRRRFVPHADEKSACVSGSGSGVRGVPPMLNSARWHCTSPRRGRLIEWSDQRRGIRFHFRPRRFCRRCASDASYDSVGNAGSIDVTTSDIPLRTDSVKRCKG